MATHVAHESHGNHPMGLVAFITLMAGGLFSALWVITLTELPAHKGTNIAYGIIALGLLLTSAAIYASLTRHLHHSPVVPDNTPAEIERYLDKVHRAGQ
ncbi:MAG: hypothetical protein QM774_00120 [Gordonia sp. (in: high G+C Gram-positive bacteria)]|uniref:hypothetical protein n=1 Tax=Gordonia sp. (in: high G+C Gram-positive bacteria) TaxID=84139 RepID=UPI0039E52A4E